MATVDPTSASKNAPGGDDTPCSDPFCMAVDIFLALAADRSSEGQVSLAELKALAETLKSGTDETQAFCHSTHNRCIKQIHLDLLTPPRTNAFGRALVAPVEQLMRRDQARLSQRQLPNYFGLFQSVLGRSQWERFHDRAAELMQEGMREQGEAFSWRHFSKLAEIIDMRLRALVELAKSFDRFENRKEWFIAVMEGDPDGEENKNSALQFTSEQFYDVMEALYAEFSELPPGAREAYETNYTEEDREAVARLIENLGRVEE